MEKKMTFTLLLGEFALLAVSLVQYNLHPGFAPVLSMTLAAALLVYSICRLKETETN